MKTIFEVIHLGRHPLRGSLSTQSLSALVHRVKCKGESGEPGEDRKCTLTLSPEGVIVDPLRKDEGFESDSESNVSGDLHPPGSGPSSLDSVVKKLESSNARGSNSDDTSSANSSGTDSDLEVAPISVDKIRPTREALPLSSFVFCHVPPGSPDVIAMVARRPTGDRDGNDDGVQCYLFGCEKAEDVWKAYNEVSMLPSRSSRRRITSSVEIRKDADDVTVLDTGDRTVASAPASSDVVGVSVNNVIVQGSSSKPKSRPSWNLVQHTDKNGITHIEIENGSGGSVTPDLASLLYLDGISEPSSIISISAPDPPPESFQRSQDDKEHREHRSRQRKPPMFIRGSSTERVPQRNRFVAPDDLFNPSHHSSLRIRTPEEQPQFYREKPTSLSSRYPNRSKKPVPPPRKHHSTHDSGEAGTEPGNTFLVPTKSGAEPHRTPYPKEAHVIRGKYIRVNSIPSGPFEFYPQTYFTDSPWGIHPEYFRNPSGRSSPQHPRGLEMPELRGRSRWDFQGEGPRRRSRSKSPVRHKPASNRYIDVSGWAGKFRELGDAMIPKKFRDKTDDFAERMKSFAKSPSPPVVVLSRDPKSLKPALRRSCRKAANSQNGHGDGHLPNANSRRVTFNAFATVQLLIS